MKCTHPFVYIQGCRKGHCLGCHQELTAVTTTKLDTNLHPAVSVETQVWVSDKDKAKQFIAELKQLEKEAEDQGANLIEPQIDRNVKNAVEPFGVD
jgi:hypothetical protein